MRFVEEIAEFIHSSEVLPENFTIILPSERMKKYLNEAISLKFDKHIFAPNIQTIDNWMKECVPQRVVDRTALLLKLYEVHQSIENDPEKSSFDAFYAWGEILINDFNDIDRYLTDAKDIFKNLASIKEIEQWSFNSTELTEGQKRFMEFWDKLPEYYETFSKKLEKEGLAYSGKGFRHLAENIEHCFKKGDKEHFIFAGFNALSPSELSVIKQLSALGRAQVFIDADKYYLDKAHHEAGAFIRSYSSDLKSENPLKNTLKSKALEIDLIACAQHTGQVKVMADLLEQMSPNERDQTLVLLADESLISAAVKNLPMILGKANISMGIPLKSTAVRTLVDLVFSIQHNAKRYKVDGYYHVDVLKVIKHPFVQAVLKDDELMEVDELERKINKGRGKYIFIERSFEIDSQPLLSSSNLVLDILKISGNSWDQKWSLAIHAFKEIARILFDRMKEESAFEKAGLEAFFQTLITFENNLIQQLPEMGLKSFRQLFDQHWSRETIAYHGAPTSGLQITGLLETRGLDFKRIICVGLNEGKLPPTNPLQTLIPMDLRRFHKLPVPRDKQGIFAHHIYRLLHHCEKMSVTYSIAETPFGMHEPSRYIMQWEKELARDNANIKVNHMTYVLENTHAPQDQDIPKTEKIFDRLDDLIGRSLTASKLKTYLNCPLDFYYKHVLEFGDKDSVEEEIEQATFGTLIHQTLEELYKKHTRYHRNVEILQGKHQPLVVEDVDYMKKTFKLVLTQKFKNHFRREENFRSGNNFLAFEIAKDLIERFLNNERKFLEKSTEPVYIEALEYEMEVEKELFVGGVLKKVKFKGNADRIDRIGEHLRIIDYKSGKVNEEDVTILKTGEEVLGRSIRNRKHILQLVQYSWMYQQKTGKLATSGIYSFLDRDSIFHELHSDKMDLSDILENYPKEIENILNELYDSSQSFSHIQRQFSFCNYCE